MRNREYCGFKVQKIENNGQNVLKKKKEKSRLQK